MGEVIQLSRQKKNKFEVEYLLDENKKPYGVTHPLWGFEILRDDSGTKTAMVMKDCGHALGELESKQFNTVLMCWLIIDQPELVPDLGARNKEVIRDALNFYAKVRGCQHISEEVKTALSALDEF